MNPSSGFVAKTGEEGSPSITSTPLAVRGLTNYQPNLSSRWKEKEPPKRARALLPSHTVPTPLVVLEPKVHLCELHSQRGAEANTVRHPQNWRI